MAFWAPGPSAPFDPTALQAAIDTLETDVGTLQGKVNPIEVLTVSGGAISTHTFSDLGGASVVRFELEWVKGALTNSAVLIRPNGVSTDQVCVYTQGDGSSSAGDLSIAGLVLAVGNRGPGGHGIVTMTLATGKTRTVLGTWGIGGDPATATSNRDCVGYSLWSDTATAITSLQVDCVDAGTLLAASDLLDGTTISLFKVR